MNEVLSVIEYSNQAMLYELMTYPKFGLVSPYSRGAHNDMDHFLFIDSSAVLTKYMYLFALLGYRSGKIEDFYEEAVKIGKDCEKEMFAKTNGVNTHKGLIFVLGTIVVASYKALYDKAPFFRIFLYCRELTKNKMVELDILKDISSHGEKVYQKYGIRGARFEAYNGFPIIEKALGFIDLNDLTSLVKTLIYIMSKCDDTTIAYRKGKDTLEKVKKKMSNLLETGYELADLLAIEAEFERDNISPGGSADLLCGTIFLSLIKNKFMNRSEGL